MMTIAGSVVGLLPVMFSSGTGSEVTRHIATPMVGGMVSATVLTLIVFPAVFALVKEIPIRHSLKWKGRKRTVRKLCQALNGYGPFPGIAEWDPWL